MFSGAFDQFNAWLLNKSIHFFKNYATWGWMLMKIKRFKPSSILLLPQIYSITICSGLKMHLLLNLSFDLSPSVQTVQWAADRFLREVVALLNTVLNISLHGLCLDIQLAQCNSQILIQNPLHVIIFSLNLLFWAAALPCEIRKHT